jgi:hypothetical protein
MVTTPKAVIYGIVIGVVIYLLLKEGRVLEKEKTATRSEPESIETEKVYFYNNIGLRVTAIYEANTASDERTLLHEFLDAGDDTFVRKKINSLLIVCDEQGIEYTPEKPKKDTEGYWATPGDQSGKCN